jgi:N-methylhydantoinase B
VLDDVKRELVSIEGAKRYGVIITPDLSVNLDETLALRKDLMEQRGEPELFNFGGTIEEIKARCEAETHLPAPSTPKFKKARA